MKTTKSIITVLFVLLTAHIASAYYCPSTGRWLSRDPVGEPGFQNLRAGHLPSGIGNSALQPSGRWIYRDPITPDSQSFQHQQLGFYYFANNQPISYFDLIGLLTAGGGVPTTDPWPIIGEHNNVLTFTISCPSGTFYHYDSVDYSGAVPGLSQIFGSQAVTSLAGPIPPAVGLGGFDSRVSPNPSGVNCQGNPNKTVVFMRSRFTDWWAGGTPDGVTIYADTVVINYHCELCSCPFYSVPSNGGTGNQNNPPSHF